MKLPELESKRIFLIATPNADRLKRFQDFISEHVYDATVFHASDGQEALFKVHNVVPHVAIVDAQLEKTDGYELTDKILAGKSTQDVAVVIVSEIPDKEHFVDEIILSRVQFMAPQASNEELHRCLTRAMNRVALHEKTTYRMRFLNRGDVLFSENESADSVFFVKRGELEATKENGTIRLGSAGVGEFVGEMAHFNSAPRSATVTAISDAELIEIPFGVLDMVLFSKPVWTKALVATLSRRLKASNESMTNLVKDSV